MKLHSKKLSNVIILRACRFFPEKDDGDAIAGSETLEDENIKFLHCLNGRRLTLRDVVNSHLAAFALNQKSFLSSGSLFHVLMLGNVTGIDQTSEVNGELIQKKYGEALEQVLQKKNWRIPELIDRVYDARYTYQILEWTPIDTPVALIQKLSQDEPIVW